MPISVVVLQIIYQTTISINSIPSPQQHAVITTPRKISYLRIMSPLLHALRLDYSPGQSFFSAYHSLLDSVNALGQGPEQVAKFSPCLMSRSCWQWCMPRSRDASSAAYCCAQAARLSFHSKGATETSARTGSGDWVSACGLGDGWVDYGVGLGTNLGCGVGERRIGLRP
jgi:hypothetical protein